MLYIIGIGLNDEKDITVKGLEAIKNCDKIYLETYTSKLQCSVEELEKFYENDIIKADRKLVEQSGEILEKAQKQHVALLVMGDIFSATTHFQIYKEAKEKNIDVKTINNASILNAVGQTGLQLYKFGRTASIPFHNKDVTAPYEVYKNNQKIGLHTLFLLDLKPDEEEYMTIGEAIQYLLRVSEEDFTRQTLCIGCARLGSNDATIKAGNAEELENEDFGMPPYSLIIPGEMHFLEEEALQLWQ